MKYKEIEDQYNEIYRIVNSSDAFEEIVGMQGFGLAPVKTEGASIRFEDTAQGFIDRATHVTYGLAFTITREMYEDGRAATQALKRAEALAMSIKQTRETVCANVLNRAFNSSYTFGDGKELCATDHPYHSGGTWRNELSTAADLNETSLEQACTDIRTQFLTDKGLQISIKPRKLIIHPNNEFEAARILKSEKQYDTANNAINAIRTMGAIPEGYKCNDYLTDTDAWFIVTDCPEGMTYFNRRDAEFGSENDWDTENAKFKATIRFSVTCGDKRGIFGSPGAA